MSSPALLIEAKVLAVLTEAGAVDELTSANVFPREQPELVDKDPSVICVVVIGTENATKDKRTNSTVLMEYPVLVMLAKKTAMTVRKADPWKKQARWQIWNLLYRNLFLGLDGVVRRCSYNPTPDFTPIGFITDYKISAQLFVYRTEEPKPISGVYT